VEVREELVLRFEGIRTKEEKIKGYICEFVFAHYGLTEAEEQYYPRPEKLVRGGGRTRKLARHRGNVNKRKWASRSLEATDQSMEDLPTPRESVDLGLCKCCRCRKVQAPDMNL